MAANMLKKHPMQLQNSNNETTALSAPRYNIGKRVVVRNSTLEQPRTVNFSGKSLDVTEIKKIITEHKAKKAAG
jgi:hypothetical protein